MSRFALITTALIVAASLSAAPSALPPPADHQIDFGKEIKPLFEAACINCHAKGKNKGGFSLETRESFLKGGDTGPAAVPGKSAESLVVKLVAGLDPDMVMPKKGTNWTPAQASLLRAWIDQGLPWEQNINFKKPEPANLLPHAVQLPDGPQSHPAARLLARYFTDKKHNPQPVVEDRIFARRAYLDTTGPLPTTDRLNEFPPDPPTKTPV